MVVSRWSEKELRNLEKGDFDFDTIGLRGRDGTKEDIDNFVPRLVVGRKNHGEYQVLIASGHVRSGKTRIGQEVFKWFLRLFVVVMAFIVPFTCR